MLDWLFGKKKQEPKKPKKNEKEDNKWKYDLLVQFLCSPEWRVTVLNFVDQNCIVFDSEEQNKFAYTDIHKKFKKLVAGLFDSVMEEIGLAEEELVELIAQGLESKNKRLFEQLLICDDFLKFKEVMVKRNRALEKEAANQLLKQGTKSHLIEGDIQPQPALNRPPSLAGQKTAEQLEDEMLRRAMEESALEEESRKSRIKDLEMEEMRKFEHESAIRDQQQQEQKRRRAEEQIRQRERMQEQERAIQQENRRKLESERHLQDMERLKQKELEREKEQQREREREKAKSKELPPVKRMPKPEYKPEPEVEIPAEIPVVQFEAEQPPAPVEQKKSESIEDRKRRLLEQRELLKKKKMEERQKELQSSQPAKNVENIVLDDQGFHDIKPKEEAEPEEKVSSDEIERRRNLMKRIKNKIIDDI